MVRDRERADSARPTSAEVEDSRSVGSTPTSAAVLSQLSDGPVKRLQRGQVGLAFSVILAR